MSVSKSNSEFSVDSIESIIQREVVTVDPDCPIEDLAELLDEHGISGVPVVEGQSKQLVGVVSRADLAAHLAGYETKEEHPPPFYQNSWAQFFKPDHPVTPDTITVGKIMTPFVFSADESTSLKDLMDMMLDNGIHRVVITRGDQLAGVVTSMDLLTHFRKRL